MGLPDLHREIVDNVHEIMESLLIFLLSVARQACLDKKKAAACSSPKDNGA